MTSPRRRFRAIGSITSSSNTRSSRRRCAGALRPIGCRESRNDPRTPLSVRHHAARRRADQRRRFHAARQARHRGACSTSSASTMSRAAIRAPIRSTRELFARTASSPTTFTAFGMTRRPGRSASNDPGLAALLDAQADAICFVAKSWDYHVRVALECTLEENLASIRDSMRAARAARPRGAARLRAFLRRLQGQSANMRSPARRRPMRKARAGSCCATPMAARCRTRWRAIVAEVVKRVPGDHVGIHAHNDTEQAVANSLAAVRGRRAPDPGHAQRARRALRQRQPRLASSRPSSSRGNSRRASTSASRDEKLAGLTHVSRALDEMLNRAPNRHAPYVGESAFATKAGIHASAILKEPATYEHVAARRGRQPAQAPGLRPGRQLQRAGRARAHRHQGRPRTIRASPRCSRRSSSARRSAMPMRRRMPPSSSWRGACSARCRAIST